MLPPHLTIAASAAPGATEATELVVVVIIVVLVAPSFVLLFRLAQRGHLRDSEAALAGTPPQTYPAARRAATSRPPGRAGGSGGAAAADAKGSRSTETLPHPRLVALVLAAAIAARVIQRLRDRAGRPSG